jgi:signal peptidase I
MKKMRESRLASLRREFHADQENDMDLMPSRPNEASRAVSSRDLIDAADAAVSLRRRARLMFALLCLLALMGVNLAIGAGKVHFDKVTSESMEPTLLVGDVLLCDVNATPERYSIVVADDPVETGGKLVKRVMAMPDDLVKINGGILMVKRLYANRFREEYSLQIKGNQMIASDGRWSVPPDDVFLMGDNRNNSDDSRVFGPVPMRSIRGVVLAIIWPPSRWRRPEPYRNDAPR